MDIQHIKHFKFGEVTIDRVEGASYTIPILFCPICGTRNG